MKKAEIKKESTTLAPKKSESAAPASKSTTPKKTDKRGLDSLDSGLDEHHGKELALGDGFHGDDLGHQEFNLHGLDGHGFIQGLSHDGHSLYPGLGLAHHGEGHVISAHVKEIVIEKKVAVPVPQPYPVHVIKHVPVPVKVEVPVDVPRPYIVKVPKPYPVIVEKHVPVEVHKPVPVLVKVPVHVPVPVPHHVEVPHPVHIEVPHPVPLVYQQQHTSLCDQKSYIGHSLL